MPFTEKMQFETDMNKKLLSHMIRKERLQQNISLRALSEYAGITPQFLSDIEHGKKSPSEYALRQIEKALHVKFYMEDSYRTEVKDLCYRMYDCYAKLEKQELYEHYEMIQKQKNIFRYSAGLPYYLFAHILYQFHLHGSHPQIYDDLQELDSIHFALPSNDLVKLYDLYGYKYLYDGNNQKADYYLQKALEISSVNMVIENAILYSHLSLYYYVTNHPWEALHACDTSITLSNEIYAYKRMINNQIKKASIYFLMKYYQKAIEKYKDLIAQAPTTKEQKRMLYNNLANCYIQTKAYRKALDCYEHAQALGSTFSPTYFYTAYCYWKLKKYDTCLTYILKNQDNEHICTIDLELMNLLKYHMEGDKQKVYASLEIILSCPEKDNEYHAADTMLSTIDVAIELYKAYGDYQRVVELYEWKEEIQAEHP